MPLVRTFFTILQRLRTNLWMGMPYKYWNDDDADDEDLVQDKVQVRVQGGLSSQWSALGRLQYVGPP